MPVIADILTFTYSAELQNSFTSSPERTHAVRPDGNVSVADLSEA